MARLRKVDPAEPGFSLPPPSRPSTRTSPRKAVRESPSKRELRYTSQDEEPSFLKPKAPTGETPGRKQRILRPVASNSRLMRRLSNESLATPEKAFGRSSRNEGLGYLYSRSLAKSVAKKPVKGASQEKKIDVAVEVETALDEDEEADQSLWCGDKEDEAPAEAEEGTSETEEGIMEVAEEDEDEEQGSIVKARNRRPLLKFESHLQLASKAELNTQPEISYENLENMPPPQTTRPPPHRKGHSMISNWAQEVIDLTDSPEPAASFVAAPLTRQPALKHTSPRPTSSASDDVAGMLVYSPTPTKQKSPRKAPPLSRPSTPPLPPAGPSKLVSPSKKKNRIPEAPKLRPELDAFWSADVVNSWNDQHSPAKQLQSPRKQKWLQLLESNEKALESDSDESFPSPTTSPRKKAPSPVKKNANDDSLTVAEVRAQRKAFATNKHSIAEAFLAEVDNTITGGKIAELSKLTGGIKLIWSKTLKTTAGRANWRREQIRLRTGPNPADLRIEIRHHCSIELAEKVIDDEERLYNVLAHEYCHLTTFMISNQRKNPHGAEFKTWASKVSRAFADRGVEVTTKHSYQIAYKYIWECIVCGYEFKRHSKSIDPVRHSCGRCKGRLVQTQPVPRKFATKVVGKGESGEPVKKSEYQIFVKKNFGRVKRDLEAKGLDAAMGKVMTALGEEYRAEKERSKQESEKKIDDVELAFEALHLGAADA